MAIENRKSFYPIVAALVHPHSRKVFAQIALGLFDQNDEQNSKVTQAITTLQRAGLIVLSKEQGYVVDTPGLKTILAEDGGAAEKSSASLDRFLREGKITQFPSKKVDRERLMRLVAAACFSGGVVLSEDQVDERLSHYHEDTALIRRYLVDHRIVERTADGSRYWLV